MEKRIVKDVYLNKNIFETARILPVSLLIIAISYLFTGVTRLLLYKEYLFFVKMALVIEFAVLFRLRFLVWNISSLRKKTIVKLGLLTVVMKIAILLAVPLLEVPAVCVILLSLGVIFFIWSIALLLSKVNFLSINGITGITALLFFSLLMIYDASAPFIVMAVFILPVLLTYTWIVLIRRDIFSKTNLVPEDFRFSFGFFQTDNTGLKTKR
ncbi:hypothetical protein HOB25_03360 [bacterium]|nr:hypothetical protein [bacterium]MBT6753999.1 hypothetical protein [bacterium]MBT7037543.1 hypothetical protein [bacterium]